MRERKGAFGVVYQDVARSEKLSIEAKGIYCYLAALSGSTSNESYPSISLMCKELKMSKTRLYKHMSELVQFGVVKKTQTCNERIIDRIYSLKNRLVLVVFFMFPILALVFKEIVSEVELDFILPSFITMNTVMVPIIFMSSIVSEEKEKKTLRMLIMSNVKAWEYLIGVGFCVFLLALISNCFFLFIIPFNAKEIVTFIVSSIIGIILSLLIGSILAILSKNQMSVGPITAPVSMIIGLLPMFSAMNSELEKIAKGIYSYYVRQMFVTRELENSVNSWLILLINFLVLSLVFAIFYRIKGLNNE